MNFPINTFQSLTTPFYAYDMALLRDTLARIGECLADKPHYRVHYAIKANNNPVLVKEIASRGFGADCVSGGEIELALKSGVKPGDIVYSGVGKTDLEIRLGIARGIGCFNVESVPELENIDEIAGSEGKTADIALRVNPDIDPHTFRAITTGTYEDQFGIPSIFINGIIEKISRYRNIRLKGLHFHIGSQITTTEPFLLLVDKINSFIDYWREKGLEFEWINVGGGLGVDYDDPDAEPVPDFASYFDSFKGLRLSPDTLLHFELGRSIVAQCGSLITRALYIKEGVNKKFAILDAGFTDLIRPALYGAHHKVDVLSPHGAAMERYDLVGPVCESTDCFARAIELPRLHRGDLLAFRSAGAYGQSMASGYNMRALPGSFYFNE